MKYLKSLEILSNVVNNKSCMKIKSFTMSLLTLTLLSSCAYMNHEKKGWEASDFVSQIKNIDFDVTSQLLTLDYLDDDRDDEELKLQVTEKNIYSKTHGKEIYKLECESLPSVQECSNYRVSIESEEMNTVVYTFQTYTAESCQVLENEVSNNEGDDDYDALTLNILRDTQHASQFRMQKNEENGVTDVLTILKNNVTAQVDFKLKTTIPRWTAQVVESDPKDPLLYNKVIELSSKLTPKNGSQDLKLSRYFQLISNERVSNRSSSYYRFNLTSLNFNDENKTFQMNLELSEKLTESFVPQESAKDLAIRKIIYK